MRHGRTCSTAFAGGIGLSLGDRVSNLNLTQQLSWAQDVIIAGIKGAGRADSEPVTVVYRAPFGEGTGQHGQPAPMVARKAIESSGVDADNLFVQVAHTSFISVSCADSYMGGA